MLSGLVFFLVNSCPVPAERAALVASYNPCVEDGGAQHHYDSARADEKRCRGLSRIVTEDHDALRAACKAIAAEAKAKSKANTKLQQDLKVRSFIIAKSVEPG